MKIKREIINSEELFLMNGFVHAVTTTEIKEVYILGQFLWDKSF